MIKLGMQDVAKRGDINELMNFDWCFINFNFWIVQNMIDIVWIWDGGPPMTHIFGILV